MSRKVFVAGGGTFLPGDPVPKKEINKYLGELDKAPKKIQRWIKNSAEVMAELLDIEYYHYAIDPITREFIEDNVTMSVKAAKEALKMACLEANDIDLICYGSAHQDQMPTASVRIQEELGIEICDELSIHANCSSAYKALYLAHELIKNGKNRRALVISSNISSSELRAEYYNQELVDKESLLLRWFLSDGAGAVILSAEENESCGYEVEHTYIESIGGKKSSLMYNKRPSLYINPKEEYEKGLHHLRQNFRNELSTSVFQEENGSIFFNGFNRMIDESKITLDTMALFQVNLPSKHIVESIMDEFMKLGVDSSVFYSRLNDLGYCGPPMALISLDKIIREENIESGKRVVSFVTEVSKFMQAGYILKRV